MIDFALDENGDVYIDDDGNEAIVTGTNHIMQHINQRIKFFRNDYFFARDKGLPWYQEIYNGMSIDAVESILKDEILGTPFVLRFDTFQTNFERSILTVNFCVWIDTPQGEIKICVNEDYTA